MHEYTDPAIRITLLPRDTNSRGTIFGGVILSYIDTAGAIEAHRHTRMETLCHRRDEGSDLSQACVRG
jgi:acyl-CoA thioesterase YciA